MIYYIIDLYVQFRNRNDTFHRKNKENFKNFTLFNEQQSVSEKASKQNTKIKRS